MTEKAVRRLAELVPTYQNKLQDKEVFSNFMAVVSRTKSFATAEMKEAVTEWQTQLSKVGEGERARRGGGRGHTGCDFFFFSTRDDSFHSNTNNKEVLLSEKTKGGIGQRPFCGLQQQFSEMLMF